MTDEGMPGPKSVKDSVDEAFAPLEAERAALTAEAEEALRESAAARAGADAATTAYLKQYAQDIEGFASAFSENSGDGEDTLLLTEVVAPDDENEDPTK